MLEFNTFLTILLGFSIFLLFIVIVAIALVKINKRGSSVPSTTMFGATDAFFNMDKRHAIEMIVEQKANKKLEEQESSEGKKKERK